MKIGKFPRSRDRLSTKQAKRQRVSLRHSSFLDNLQELTVDPANLDIALEAIEEYAKRLRQSPTFSNLRQYKQAIRSFLKSIVTQVYSVRQRTFYERSGQRRVYLLVEQVDQQLEELTQTFLKGQVSSIDLARRLDEIRGMLLDLYS